MSLTTSAKSSPFAVRSVCGNEAGLKARTTYYSGGPKGPHYVDKRA
jgi:hypothetical protein